MTDLVEMKVGSGRNSDGSKIPGYAARCGKSLSELLKENDSVVIKAMGGDAVGMSTVPEVIVANHCNIKTVGISCLTNMAAGILDQPLNHEEVIETSAKVKNDFIKLMNRVIEII